VQRKGDTVRKLPNSDTPPVQVTNLFEPDILARYEFPKCSWNCTLCQQRLMFAVLADAINVFSATTIPNGRICALCHNAEV
jgi:hypothetical protein